LLNLNTIPNIIKTYLYIWNPIVITDINSKKNLKEDGRKIKIGKRRKKGKMNTEQIIVFLK